MCSSVPLLLQLLLVLSCFFSCPCVYGYLSATSICRCQTISSIERPATLNVLTSQSVTSGRANGKELAQSTTQSYDSEMRGQEKFDPSGSVKLPVLSNFDVAALRRGERVQKQDRAGRSGYGFVVLEVDVAPERVFDALTQISDYQEMIPTVRGVQVYSKTANMVAAELYLSRFYLKLNVIHSILREHRIVKFRLDNNKPNLVLRKAEGFWFVQSIESGSPENPYTKSRVYLSADIVASRLVPTMIVDYAAARALPRATTWLQQFFNS